jgi:GNAT superfamily N-acetyltransferase
MRRDCLQDLLLFEPVEPWQPPQHEFLREAARRLKNGYHVYTDVLDGRLVHYGWLVEKQENCSITEDPAFTLPPNSALLFDFYTHPHYRGQGLYMKSLRQMFFDAAAEKQHIDIFVLKNNAAEGRVIETAGFEYEKSFFERNRFGMVSRWEGRRQMSPYLKKSLQRNEKPI